MATSEVVNLTAVERDTTFVNRLTPAGRLLSRCIQCGTCSASCPTAHAMDLTPRQMWRLAQLGFQDQVLHSKAMWLCSLCYTCHVRCPRGIPLTETIVKLKQLALQEGIVEWRESTAFYRAFADVMRRYGHMREIEFMVRYFLAANPLAALGYARLGLTLLARGKAHLELPLLGGEGRLDRLFERVAELEGQR
ncbi:MAG: 4Fe-4S dicluster domain-containing protein [Anaerolineae bacterium]